MQTLIWYLCATSSSKGTIESVGTPFSSFKLGGYQETAMTPKNSQKNRKYKAEVLEFVS